MFAGILIAIVLKLSINLGRIGIFFVLHHLICEHGISLHLFRSLIYCISVSMIFNIKFYTSFWIYT